MDANFPTEFLTGRAGTGKTYELKRRIKESHNKDIEGSRKGNVKGSKNYATLCATTGIAAVNLAGGLDDPVVTINSELGFFDTESLMDAAGAGRIQRSLAKVFNKGRNLAIDEVSMMGADCLDILVGEFEVFNSRDDVQARGGLGLILAGDFCQLGPIKEKYAFQGRTWGYFASNVTRLSKVWRQTDQTFLEAINAAREGDGDKAAAMLSDIQSITWRGVSSTSFDGTTIVATNLEADRINNQRLQKLIRDGNKEFTLSNFRWGKQRGEWKLIPDELKLCDNGYVMILCNDCPKFTYANGDCGYVKNFSDGFVDIELARGEVNVRINKVTRQMTSKEGVDGEEKPKWMSKKEFYKHLQETYEGEDGLLSADTKPSLNAAYENYLASLTYESRQRAGKFKPYFDFLKGKWVLGEITYYPLRLAYASTCHKSQGLSLDKVQIDYNHNFFGQPSMSYVALSRCKTPEGLTIVGGRDRVAMKTNISELVVPWI